MKTKRSFALAPRFIRMVRQAIRFRGKRNAFTFVELLVVLAVLAVMVSVVATALAGSRPNFQAALCYNNMRQLMAAFTMYTHDNADIFPPNPDAAFTTPGCSWVLGNATGWIPAGTSGSPDAGNPDLLKDGTKNLLAAYTRTNISLFRCPFDPRVAPYTGSDTNLAGQNIPVVRDISMNQGVGTKGVCAAGANANATVDGPWLDGSHTHTANNPYATFGRWSDFKSVRPSEIWVLVDDDPWTINDSSMAVIAAFPDGIDYVNVFNNNSTCFSFADGHVETHKWKSKLWIHSNPPSRADFVGGTATSLGYQDWFWWASHATRSRITNTVP